MKKIIYALLATISGLVLVFSYRTSLEAVPPTASTEPAASGTTSSGGAAGSTSSGMTDGEYTGGAANTRYGPVQVQITVSGGEIADVQVTDYPHSDRRDQEINQRALPILVSETTQTQSSRIDMVSGATYTSQGYIASLQSAIDQANA
jgi:uncharacterized protein with FMN-binding domain